MKINSSRSSLGFVLTVFSFVTFIFSSYVVNVYKFVNLDFASAYKAEVVRGISIFVPIFPISAWLDIGEENSSAVK